MALPLLKNPDLMQNQWKSALDPIIANTIVRGLQLTGVTIGTSDTTVPHGLDRMQQGWFITDSNAAATVFRTGDFNSTSMVLTASAIVTVSIWVY